MLTNIPNTILHHQSNTKTRAQIIFTTTAIHENRPQSRSWPIGLILFLHVEKLGLRKQPSITKQNEPIQASRRAKLCTIDGATSLPRPLSEAWHCREYYGSLSHNVKGIYQKYMTWFNGNPAHLWQHPWVEEGKRYVENLGGIEATVGKAVTYAQRGDLRFAATLLDHAVAAEPTSQPARLALVSVYERLGYGAECGSWRNFYLTGAQDMRNPEAISKRVAPMSNFNPSISIEEWLDKLAIKIDGQRAAEESLVIVVHIPEEKLHWRLNLSNGALTCRMQPETQEFSGMSGLVLITSRKGLFDVVAGKAELGSVSSKGDQTIFHKLMELASPLRFDMCKL